MLSHCFQNQVIDLSFQILIFDVFNTKSWYTSHHRLNIYSDYKYNKVFIFDYIKNFDISLKTSHNSSYFAIILQYLV